MDLMGTLNKPTINMCEVLFKDNSGNWPQFPLVDQVQEFGGYFIGQFSTFTGISIGTGFIIQLCSSSSQFDALVLTSAHIFVENYKYRSDQRLFIIGNEQFIAMPLKCALDWSNSDNFYQDPISKAKVSIPEDWLVCGLIKKYNKVYAQPLVTLPLYDSSDLLNLGDEISVFGFPNCPDSNSLKYIAPNSIPSDINAITNALCGGNKLVASKGKIIAIGETLCVTCPTANGMSGGPVIINTTTGRKVIGVLFGGPASHIHYYSAKILNIKRKGRLDLESMNYLYNYLKSKNFCTRLTIELENLLELVIQGNTSLSILSNVYGCISEIYCSAVELERNQGTNIDYNVAISISTIYSELISAINNL